MRPTLRQLQYLVAIADTGHFGDAAKRMNVSQPGMSAQLSTMEAELGVMLIERTPQGAILTSKGEEVVRRARLVLRDVEDLKSAAKLSPHVLAGNLRLGVLPTVGPYLLPPAARRLHAAYPDLRFNINEELALDLNEHLHSGHYDIIISSPEDHPNCKSIPLFDESMWVCLAADDPLAHVSGPVTPDALEARTIISNFHWPKLDRIVTSIAGSIGAIVSHEYEGTSLDAIRQMAEMGSGIAVLPGLYALTEIKRDPDMIVRCLAHPKASRSIALIYRATSPFEENLDVLAGIIRETGQDILTV